MEQALQGIHDIGFRDRVDRHGTLVVDGSRVVIERRLGRQIGEGRGWGYAGDADEVSDLRGERQAVEVDLVGERRNGRLEHAVVKLVDVQHQLGSREVEADVVLLVQHQRHVGLCEGLGNHRGTLVAQVPDGLADVESGADFRAVYAEGIVINYVRTGSLIPDPLSRLQLSLKFRPYLDPGGVSRASGRLALRLSAGRYAFPKVVNVRVWLTWQHLGLVRDSQVRGFPEFTGSLPADCSTGQHVCLLSIHSAGKGQVVFEHDQRTIGNHADRQLSIGRKHETPMRRGLCLARG